MYHRQGADPQTFGLPFIKVSAPSIVSGMSGESEKTLRDTFDEAKVIASTSYAEGEANDQKLAPCILFLDEVDAITPKRETAQREMERRIVAQLLTCFDGMSSHNLHG
jgi:ribosome biogenesis ATPase